MRKIVSILLVSIFVLSNISIIPVHAAYTTTNDGYTVVNYAKAAVGTHAMSKKGLCQTFAWECLYDTLGVSNKAGCGCCATKAWQSYGVSSSRDDIPLGAAVYFGGSSTIDSVCNQEAGHVGIYIGNNEIAHAWSSTIICKTTIDYVINCGYYYRGWGWQGGYPLATETPIYTEKPDKPQNIISGKKVYKPGEEIIFSWDASENATDYKIQIWNGNILLYSDSIGNVTSFTTPLADTGNCAICVSAGNPVGYSDYELYSFVVTSDIPNKPNAITANKLVCNTGEEVTFSWDAVDLATDYWVSIYNGDTKVYNSSVGNVTNFTSPFAYEGTYAFCVYSGNSNGYSQDTTYKFYVTNSVPQKPTFYAQKEIYKPNENIKFAWSKIDLATDYWVIIWKGDSQIESFSTNNTTEITRSFSDNGNYAILVCSMNSNGRSEYVMHQFSITGKSIISAEAHVKNGSYIIKVQLHNIISGHIFVAGYNDNRLIDLKTPLFNQESVSTTLTGDIDEIKVMVWNSLPGMVPLCEAEVIPSSDFIVE